MLSQQQQEYIHEQQELKGTPGNGLNIIIANDHSIWNSFCAASNDLPPKYEDVVKTIPYTGIPMGFVLPSSSQPPQRSTEISIGESTAQPQRF